MKFTETDIKYLAGLLDADGSIFFHFMPYKDYYNVTLKVVLQQSLSIDKGGKFLGYCAERLGTLQFVELSKNNPNWSDANRWVVSGRELELLVPRIVKHMVIKGKHFEDMFNKFKTIYGNNVSQQEMEQLKEFAKVSRKNAGPLRAKKHPTWAWVAGYLDGDGCYYMRTRRKFYKELLVQVVAHDDDIVGLELLAKAFGGILRKNSYENTYTWKHNLGVKDRSFAIMFLRKMVNHSRMKKHKIEQMLHYHSQRLSE